MSPREPIPIQVGLISFGGRLTRWTVVAAFLCLVPFLCRAHDIPTDTMVMASDSAEKIDVPEGIEKIYILGGQNVVTAKPDGEHVILVTALKHGSCRLEIGLVSEETRLIRIDVVDAELKDLADALEDGLEDIEGLDIRIAQKKLLLSGNLFRPSEVERVEAAAKEFENVVDLTDKTASREAIAAAIEKEIVLAIGTDTVDVDMDGGQYLVTGTVTNDVALKRATAIARKRTRNPKIMIRIEEF